MKIPSTALLLLVVASARHSGGATLAEDATAPRERPSRGEKALRDGGRRHVHRRVAPRAASDDRRNDSAPAAVVGRGRKLGKDKDKDKDKDKNGNKNKAKEAKRAKKKNRGQKTAKTKNSNKNKETRTNLEPDLLPSTEGADGGGAASSRVGSRLGLGAPPNGLEGVPAVPVDNASNKLGDDDVDPRPLPAGVLVEPPPPPPPVDGAGVGGAGSEAGEDGGSDEGGWGWTYTSTGGGVTHTHTPAAEEEGDEAKNRADGGGVTARSDPCSGLPPSRLGVVPPANLGRNVMVEAPPSTWAACDESCEGYPDACAHKGYFWTPDESNPGVKHLVRACLDLTGLNRWARRGCAGGGGDETREQVPWGQVTSP